MTRLLPMLVVLSGCAVDGNGASSPAKGGAANMASSPLDPSLLPPPDVHTTPLGEVDLQRPPNVSRDLKRMNLDQLDFALRQVTGAEWAVVAGVPQNVLRYAEALGYPNYTTRLDEDLSVNLLWEKVVGDAARDLCSVAVNERSVGVYDPAIFPERAPYDATFASHREAMVDNTRALVLRYHGKSLEATDPRLEPWLWLVESTQVRTADPAAPGASADKGWRALCVALIVHPDFVTY
jgi:hypothetical protein